MNLIHIAYAYILPFLVVLTPLVFVHEFGHYFVARLCKVKVEMFSIGFGPELFGFNDKTGTRWKFSLLPLGGYVKMLGDSDPSSSAADPAVLAKMTDEDRARSFWYKPVGQRAAITFAGPAANYIFAVIVLALLFVFCGQPYSPAQVGDIMPDSAASSAGIEIGDTLIEVDGAKISSFEDLQRVVSLNRGSVMPVKLDRKGQIISMMITPKIVEITDNFGFKHQLARLGITRQGVVYRKLSAIDSIPAALTETINMTTSTLKAIGQIVVGTRGTEDLGGPVRIARMSGEMAKNGAASMVWFIAILSINLGLINLFPVPILDGGHLAFYACEALRGKQLSERAQEIGARIGLAMVLCLMVLATWNDLVQMQIVSYVKNLLL